MYLAAGSEWVMFLGSAVGSPVPVFVDSECVAAVVVASGSAAAGKPAVYSPTAAAENEREREREREREACYTTKQTDGKSERKRLGELQDGEGGKDETFIGFYKPSTSSRTCLDRTYPGMEIFSPPITKALPVAVANKQTTKRWDLVQSVEVHCEASCIRR